MSKKDTSKCVCDGGRECSCYAQALAYNQGIDDAFKDLEQAIVNIYARKSMCKPNMLDATFEKDLAKAIIKELEELNPKR